MSQNSQHAVSLSRSRPASFQLKGALFPMNLLELKSSDIQNILEELEFKVSKSPAFFENSPLVIGLESIDKNPLSSDELRTLVETCSKLKLIPVATRGAQPEILTAVADLGLANLKAKAKQDNISSENGDNEALSVVETKPDDSPANAEPKTLASNTKIVESPVRSGQQIYAAGGDLIIMSAVSPGAEVLADGNIHIYGALRGRALAGVQGNTQARIFCGSQEAELVSVAGQYLVDDSLKTNHWKARTQIFLKENSLVVEPIN